MKSIAEEAQEIITGDRRQSYGPVEESFKAVAAVWNAILRTKIKEPLAPADVALLMAGLKLVRESAKPSRDNRVDVIGYMLLEDQIVAPTLTDEQKIQAFHNQMFPPPANGYLGRVEAPWRPVKNGDCLEQGDEEYSPVHKNWLAIVPALVGYVVRGGGRRYRRKIDPGEGHRVLVDGDTLQQGDDVYEHGYWHPVHEVGVPVPPVEMGFYRRKVEPEFLPYVGEGYVEVKHGEIIQEGDEYWLSGFKKWDKTICAGCRVGDRNSDFKFRRKVEPAKTADDVGDGYRKLQPGEILQQGDEYYNVNSWHKTVSQGLPVDDTVSYRRSLSS